MCIKKLSTSLIIQFSSVTQSCPTLWDPMNHSTPGLPVHHQPPEFTQTHVHRVSDAIQPSHPLLSPSPPAPNPSQHNSLLFSNTWSVGSPSFQKGCEIWYHKISLWFLCYLPGHYWLRFHGRGLADSWQARFRPTAQLVNTSFFSTHSRLAFLPSRLPYWPQ